MSLSRRLNRLERDAGQRGCPACRERKGRMVLVSAQEPGSEEVPVEEMPALCERCGEVPEILLEIVEVVAERDHAGIASDGIPQRG